MQVLPGKHHRLGKYLSRRLGPIRVSNSNRKMQSYILFRHTVAGMINQSSVFSGSLCRLRTQNRKPTAIRSAVGNNTPAATT